MTRSTSRLAAAGIAVLLLAGCGGAQTRAGAAATVGDERIAASQLEEVVERGLEDEQAQQQLGGDRAGYQRQVLNRLVRGRLLEQAVQERDIEVTQGDIDAQLEQFATQAGGREQLEQQAAAGGVHRDDLPRFAREVALEIELADALTEDLEVPAEQLEQLYQQNLPEFDKVRTRHILVEDEAQARDLLAQVQADRSAFEALAAEFSIDDSNAQDGGELGLAGRGQFVPEFEAAVFDAQPGDVVLAKTDFGWHVVEVLERQTTTPEEAREQLRRQALGEQRQEAVDQVLRETSEKVGVSVNPRFGRWDAEAVQVVPVPEDDGLSKPAPGGDAEAPDGSVPQGEPGQPAPEGEPAPQ